MVRWGIDRWMNGWMDGMGWIDQRTRDLITIVLTIGVVCVMQALKMLRTAEFKPFVVFISAPSVAKLRELRRHSGGPDADKNKHVSVRWLEDWFPWIEQLIELFTNQWNWNALLLVQKVCSELEPCSIALWVWLLPDYGITCPISTPCQTKATYTCNSREHALYGFSALVPYFHKGIDSRRHF